MGGCHIGLGSSFIDKHKPSGVNVVPIRLPPISPIGNIGPLLLAGEDGFFEADTFPLEKIMRHGWPCRNTVTVPRLATQFRQCDITVVFDVLKYPAPNRCRNRRPMTACANRLATIIPYGGTEPLNGGELTDTKLDSGHLGDSFHQQGPHQ